MGLRKEIITYYRHDNEIKCFTDLVLCTVRLIFRGRNCVLDQTSEFTAYKPRWESINIYTFWKETYGRLMIKRVGLKNQEDIV